MKNSISGEFVKEMENPVRFLQTGFCFLRVKLKTSSFRRKALSESFFSPQGEKIQMRGELKCGERGMNATNAQDLLPFRRPGALRRRIA